MFISTLDFKGDPPPHAPDAPAASLFEAMEELGEEGGYTVGEGGRGYWEGSLAIGGGGAGAFHDSPCWNGSGGGSTPPAARSLASLSIILLQARKVELDFHVDRVMRVDNNEDRARINC